MIVIRNGGQAALQKLGRRSRSKYTLHWRRASAAAASSIPVPCVLHIACYSAPSQATARSGLPSHPSRLSGSKFTTTLFHPLSSMANMSKTPYFSADDGLAAPDTAEVHRPSTWGTEQDRQGMNRMGKKQELRRQFKFLSITGYATILSCSWEFAMM